MKRMLLVLATAASVGASVASAQPVGQGQIGQPPALSRSPVSPFLNLNRGGSPGINYYGLVRPQFETQQSLTVLGQDLRQGLLATQALGAQQLPLTSGHGAVFFNTGHYYSQGPFQHRFSSSIGAVPGTVAPSIGVAPNQGLGVVGVFGR